MTAQELIDLATKSAEDASRVARNNLDEQITAGERIFARGVSEAISKTALELIRNPTF
jgi:hypothetical protein